MDAPAGDPESRIRDLGNDINREDRARQGRLRTRAGMYIVKDFFVRLRGQRRTEFASLPPTELSHSSPPCVPLTVCLPLGFAYVALTQLNE